jgi:hypothetical protein
MRRDLQTPLLRIVANDDTCLMRQRLGLQGLKTLPLKADQVLKEAWQWANRPAVHPVIVPRLMLRFVHVNTLLLMQAPRAGGARTTAHTHCSTTSGQLVPTWQSCSG